MANYGVESQHKRFSWLPLSDTTNKSSISGGKELVFHSAAKMAHQSSGARAPISPVWKLGGFMLGMGPALAHFQVLFLPFSP